MFAQSKDKGIVSRQPPPTPELYSQNYNLEGGGEGGSQKKSKGFLKSPLAVASKDANKYPSLFAKRGLGMLLLMKNCVGLILTRVIPLPSPCTPMGILKISKNLHVRQLWQCGWYYNCKVASTEWSLYLYCAGWKRPANILRMIIPPHKSPQSSHKPRKL